MLDGHGTTRVQHRILHPFGAHAGSARSRPSGKRSEVEASDRLCVHSSIGAHDPMSSAAPACEYRAGSEATSEPIPSGISVPHPSSRAGRGSAFVVDGARDERVQRGLGVVWFSPITGIWRTDRLPTRREYLVRMPGPVRVRPVYCVLRLKWPFLVEIRSSSWVSRSCSATQRSGAVNRLCLGTGFACNAH